MIDLLSIPAVWGVCGGLLSGLNGLATAYSKRAGTPEARVKAWLRLGFGIIAGPIAAQAMTESVLKVVPALGTLNDADARSRLQAFAADGVSVERR